MTKKEIKEICEATFRRLYSFSKEEYKFFDWVIEPDDIFEGWNVRVYVLSIRHTIYRCYCHIDEFGLVEYENHRALV